VIWEEQTLYWGYCGCRHTTQKLIGKQEKSR